MKKTAVKKIAALSVAALLSASVYANEGFTKDYSGFLYKSDFTLPLYGHGVGYVFGANDLYKPVDESKAPTGATFGLWAVDLWSSNATTPFGAPNRFGTVEKPRGVSASDLDRVPTASNFANVPTAVTGADPSESYSWRAPTFAIGFASTSALSGPTFENSPFKEIDLSFSSEMLTADLDGGVTSALLGFGILALVGFVRRKTWTSGAEDSPSRRLFPDRHSS